MMNKFNSLVYNDLLFIVGRVNKWGMKDFQNSLEIKLSCRAIGNWGGFYW